MTEPTDTTSLLPHRTLRDTEGLACPACGQADRLVIEMVTQVEVTAAGTTETPQSSFGMWTEASDCCCPTCGHWGRLGDFEVPRTAPADGD